MHELALADAISQKPTTVFGLRLLPFTIGHELLLWKMQNALATYSIRSFGELSEMEQSRALARAVLICCHRGPRWTRWWSIQCRRMNLAEEVGKFREYRAMGSMDLPTKPIPRSDTGHFHYLGAPELARLINYVSTHQKAFMVAHFDGTPLNFPFGLARILYLTHLESEGNIWVKNSHDIENEMKQAAFEQEHPENTFAMGEEAVQALAEKWNAEHPESPVPLMVKRKGQK